MTFVTGNARPPLPRYVDLDRCVLLGPDAALISSLAESSAQLPPAAYPDPCESAWLLELYEDEDDTVRVLIVGDEE